MKKLLVILIIAVMPSLALASEQAGQDIVVLKAGVGARALGMGSAFTAIADNADAPYWNPAGLTQLKYAQATTMQTRLSTDVDHYYISFVQPLTIGTWGMSWIQMGLGDITQTAATLEAHNEVQNLGIFNYYSNAYLLSYGVNILENLSFGVTAKYLNSSMSSITSGEAWGYSVTPAVLYKPLANLSIGVKVDELVNQQKWQTETVETVPPKLRVGVAYRLPGLILSSDYSRVLKEGYSGLTSYGVEWNVFDGIYLRGGAEDGTMSAGVGFRSNGIRVDYAYVTQAALSRDNVHRISLTGRW